MNINALKLSLLTYFQHLSLYDYLAFGWLCLTFLILIFLAILVAKKSSAFALLIIIVSLLFLGIAPFFIYQKLNTTLRKTETTITLLKKLNFSSSLILETTITNQSKKDFNLCILHASIFKADENISNIKAYLYQLKPLANQSIIIKEFIPQESTLEYRIVFDDFDYSGDINATLKAECY
ncbi:DUF2393 domain-containing protein [Sulfurospirillum deleyianum]|uniref:DUF2393 domain-containing protein n=1 Tax=Sulfurospirillum deleyianum (strain ATCC 51133 / DSM 6946 / 5175) TaxID=525898 RepID=D1AZ77_SULD5|nr:DUF2393 domain-containing protein [Sulfurospirillum deleyianum]ACZ11215.1 conserved hypothetical protein [Sulfurospirillum deleyianum DSM 6946]